MEMECEWKNVDQAAFHQLAIFFTIYKILCGPFRFLRGIFYASTIFNIKLINRHWTRDNMMLKHIIYVSIFSLLLTFSLTVYVSAPTK